MSDGICNSLAERGDQAPYIKILSAVKSIKEYKQIQKAVNSIKRQQPTKNTVHYAKFLPPFPAPWSES
jgi:hypothetical protein